MIRSDKIAFIALLLSTVSQAALADNASGSAISPYQLNLLYTGEAWDNTQGGIKAGSEYMNNMDAALFVDGSKAFGWNGAHFHLEGFYTNHHSFELDKTGTIDTQSSIDTTGPSMLRLYQAYYDQDIGTSNILFGIYDLETEFSNTKPELLFLGKNFTWNTAFDQSGTMPQNGNVGPGNYPYTPLAVRYKDKFSTDWGYQVALADGVSDKAHYYPAGTNPEQTKKYASNNITFNEQSGALGIGEVDYQPNKYDKVFVGIWGLTSHLPSTNQTNADGSQKYEWGEEGGYFGGSKRLYTQEGRRGLDGFFTVGFADPVSANVDQSYNAGLTYTGLFDERPSDKAGIAVALNHDPAPWKKAILASGAANAYSTETTFEATYRAAVIKDWVTMQPDMQYTVHPGYQYKDDFIIGLHFEIGHLFNL